MQSVFDLKDRRYNLHFRAIVIFRSTPRANRRLALVREPVGGYDG